MAKVATQVGLDDVLGDDINPATSDNQTNKTQMTQITDGTEEAAVTVQKELNVLDSGYFNEVAKGNVPGVTFVHKFCFNPEIDANVTETIWDLGGVYTFSTTAAIDTISSSDAGDTQDVVIFGLDADYNDVTQTATLNGQNKVVIGTPLLRAWRMFNNGTTDFAGQIYLYEDSAITAGVPNNLALVRAHVNDGNNQTLMGTYTVPAGKTGYLTHFKLSVTSRSSTAATFNGWIRSIGKVFRLIATAGFSSNAQYEYELKFPIALPEKTDIDPRVTSGANGTSVSMEYDLLLIDN